MIKYNLTCKNCNLLFDSWFASSNEFEKLKKKKFLNCHKCNSEKIEKSLMAPRLIGNKKKDFDKQQIIKIKQISKKIKEYQNFVKKNFEYVGENFAYEARSIHYDKKKKNKRIYGTASRDEMKELKEEGIETEIIPWVRDKNN